MFPIKNIPNFLKEKFRLLGNYFNSVLRKILPYQNDNEKAWPTRYQWKQFFKILSKNEKYSILGFCLLIIISLSYIFWAWYLNNTLIGPANGGTYTEVAVGAPRYLNPVLSSTNDVDRDLVAIIYSGLLKYDQNGQLVPDLAEAYSINSDKKTYEMRLRQNIKWHDGETLIVDDVIFTIQTIQNPEYRSPLRASLPGVEAEKIDDYTLRLKLKNIYSPFLGNLTFGILPKHIWENVPAVSFSITENNLNPIGSGPYEFKKMQKDSSGSVKSIELSAFADYYFNKPYLDSIIFEFFKDEDSAIATLNNNEAQGISYASTNKIAKLKTALNLNKVVLPRYFAVFFNQSENRALTDKNVRQALLLATDKQEIVNKIIFGQAIDLPLLGISQKETTEKSTNNFNPDQAKALLDSSGWLIDASTTLRQKKIDNQNTTLEVSLLTVNWPELTDVANLLKTDWENIGVKVNLEIKSVAEIQERIKARQYQALLFGQLLSASPDPFAFWHSSQKNDPGLNLSLYENKDADRLMEEIRQEFNEDAKKQKYIQLQNMITQYLPAIFLYSPVYIFPTSKDINGIEIENIHLPSERFSQINNWYIKTKRVWK